MTRDDDGSNVIRARLISPTLSRKENPCDSFSSLSLFFFSSLIHLFITPFKAIHMPRLRLKDLEPALQAIATEDYVFRNWAKTFNCTAELLFTPSSEDEIVKVTSFLLLIVCMGPNEANRSIVVGTVGKNTDIAGGTRTQQKGQSVWQWPFALRFGMYSRHHGQH